MQPTSKVHGAQHVYEGRAMNTSTSLATTLGAAAMPLDTWQVHTGTNLASLPFTWVFAYLMSTWWTQAVVCICHDLVSSGALPIKGLIDFLLSRTTLYKRAKFFKLRQTNGETVKAFINNVFKMTETFEPTLF
ncbi:hypothetical protein PR048_023593 [Dryococelus australis]|uniref:Uncharacterized protein n=1 Tax=Dryococelus australis TaxID=614101 RepID=A0ABQ9GUQ3_9NEOP|nr:hypothetical protein PR048_023593 [Dryococelus australis]